MKRKKICLLMACAFAWGGTYALASTLNEEDHFYCGFETQEDFDRWTCFDIDGATTNNQWVWNEDVQAAWLATGADVATADDWMISPAVTLTGGKSYVIKLRLKMDYNSNLQMTMGTECTVEAQTTELAVTDPWSGDAYVKYAIPVDMSQGTYHFAVHNISDNKRSTAAVLSFEVVENRDAVVEFTVLDKQTKAPLYAKIVLSGPTYRANDWKTGYDTGFRSFSDLTPGTYMASVTCDGYYPVEKEVTLEADKTTPCTIEMEKILEATISGTVVGSDNAPVQGAEVLLTGIQNHTATTDENGRFAITGVRGYQTYKLTVSKEVRHTYTADIYVDEETMELPQVVLDVFVGSPANISAEVVEPGVLLSWMIPLSEKDFVLDDGNYAGIYTYGGFDGDYNYLGNVFNTPMTVTGMSWLLTRDGAAGETVDLYVFALNKDGSLSSDVLYSEKDVPNVNYDYGENLIWNEYTFEQPVVAPYGCIVAVGHYGDPTICVDGSGNSWSSYAMSGSENSWRSTSAPGAYFIRAEGWTLGVPEGNQANSVSALRVAPASKSKASARVASLPDGMSFNIWRFNVNDKDQQEKWTAVATGVKECNYIDRTFQTVKSGNVYQYAMQTVSTDGSQSEVSCSNEIEYNMYSRITVNVTTNTAIDFADGALVALTHLSDANLKYEGVVSGGSVVFENVRKGDYALKVSKVGFVEDREYDWFPIEKDAHIANQTLNLTPIAPFNLQAEQLEGTSDVLFRWNVEDYLSEDFEGMDAFAVNPAGDNGWAYADVDGAPTYGVSLCEATPYPNMSEPMAFMSFAPGATTPSLMAYVQPHSGEQVLVDVALADGTTANDDYLFSPELSFDMDFQLRFHATSGFWAYYGNEMFMVGYTTGEASPENVVWLTETPQPVGGVWTEFVYDMPKEAKHTVIRCVSDQCMFFVLDDITIGYKEPEVFAMTTFDVSLDGEQVGTTAQRSFLIDGLTEGRHLLQVQTVYPMSGNTQAYSALSELLFTVDKVEVSGIGSVTTEMLYTYDAQAGLIIPGQGAVSVSLYDMRGRLCAKGIGNAAVSTVGCPAGVYVLQVETGDRVAVGKILIK